MSHSVSESQSVTTPTTPPQPLLPFYSYKTNCPQAQLYYVRYVDAANRAITLLCNGPVGFDLEWKPNFVKGAQENPVALVQLATHQVVVLIQVSAMKEFPEKLKEFLENPDIVKAGVAIQNDTLKLYRDYKVSVSHCVDLSLLARTADNDNWKGQYKNPIGLSKLLEHYEKLSLKKGKTTRSNWENQLSYVQQEYAANDAHAGYTIYNRLLEMVRSMPEFPDSVYYTFDAVRGRLCEPSGAQWYARNPNYDPGPPPPPKPVKSPRIGDIVVTGTPTDQSVPSLLPPTSTPHPIVTTNPHWNPWWSNQPSQQWPNTPHINIGTQPPGMGWFNPHSNPGHNGRHVPLNNRFASHGSWKPTDLQLGNSPQYKRFGPSQQQQQQSSTLSANASQYSEGVADNVATTDTSPAQENPRQRPRNKPQSQNALTRSIRFRK